MGAQGGIERVRSIFERALTAVGLHVTKGASIWEAYREFEIVILSTVQVCTWGSYLDGIKWLVIKYHMNSDEKYEFE